MRKVLMFSSVLVILFGFFISALATGVVTQPERPEYVIIITIDGCRPDKLLDADTSNIDEIAQGAAYSWVAQTVYPSSTPPAHASLFTGAYPKTHGYYNPGDLPRAETIFQVFEGAGYKTSLVDGKGGRIAGLEVGVSYVKNDVNYRWLGEAEYQPGSEDPDGDLRVMENVIQIFVENQPTLMFVLLPIVDTAGHIYGHTSDDYMQAIEKADRAIGMLVDNLKELGIYENTLLVILSDHGMTGTNHGSRDPGDMTIPLIISGPGITAGELQDAEIVDIAPTVTSLFGLRSPGSAEGRDLFGEARAPTELVLVTVAVLAAVICIVLIMRRRRREVALPTTPTSETTGW